ncbi:MAG: hypothetical protein M0P91_09725 [Sulfuricurvum sp.]|jgi:hypothetical protein|uniref:hypothetical protein n=1 Tax=Sulfuricurvum sp. TaxID=2025608 RepID=UPI0025CF9EFD|nr:hypothetical protein [Sulfuricurvum sp.]MCK9373467.1 hypothetical protein [Sulfuricurvum sp.]
MIIENIDQIAFNGGRLDDGVESFPPRTISWGDSIIESFTMNKCSFYRTHSGYFKKEFNSPSITPILKEIFELSKRYLSTLTFLSNTMGDHTAFSGLEKRFSRAGLTRGLSVPFSDSKKARLAQLQDKYMDGVK